MNITTHGIHQWNIIPGLTDTGGQNVFVNQFSNTLVAHGFKVTIVNRGGYEHPITGEQRNGLQYKNKYQRICYLEDGLPQFVRKEDMAERVPALISALEQTLESEGSSVEMIISHYWDAMAVGVGYSQGLPEPIQHIWVPHSVGAIKKSNVSPDKWANLLFGMLSLRLMTTMDQFCGCPPASSRNVISPVKWRMKIPSGIS